MKILIVLISTFFNKGVMIKKLLILTFVLVTFVISFGCLVKRSQAEEAKGEEELFKKEEAKEDVEFKKGFNVTLGFEFDWVQAYGFSKQLFSMQNKAYEARFPLTAAYLFSENSKIYILVPYICKYALGGYSLFGGEEWDFAIGLGDIRGGVSYQIISEKQQPFNILISAEVISNTGRVHYGSLGDRHFGNGYWNIASGVGISKTVHPQAMLFGNVGYVYRFMKEYVYRFRKEGYKPRDISFYNLGIASAVGKKSFLGLEFQYTSGVRVDYGYGAESRLGISFKEVKNGVLTEGTFLGKGWLKSSKENYDYWLFIWTVPFRLKIFGVSF